jgi:neutral ceramidase
VRRLTRGRALLALALIWSPGIAARAAAAPPTPSLTAGAASVEVALPEGPPLAGYGGFPRRAWFPDVLGRHPHVFWFRPAQGVHDPVRVRALALADARASVMWLTIDLVGMDPSLTAELGDRLRRAGIAYSALIVSASHTHSGPGAYVDSALFAFVALDRPSTEIRARLLDALERAAREAHQRKAPARVGAGALELPGLGKSRIGAALDPTLGVLKVVTADGRPLALLWNYAIHGTALGKDNFMVSGDLMGEASARIESRLRVPALFVNGAVGDVSPAGRGWRGVASLGERLAQGALGAWDAIRPEADAALATASRRVSLPAPAVSARACLGRWLPGWLRVGLGDALPRSAELHAVGIGGSAWVTIPGELETRLGREIKAAGAARFDQVFVAGVSNDYLGYLLTPEATARPGYIACASFYGERGGELMRDGAVALLERLAHTRDAARARR